jgi:hypothetical protein
VSDVVESIAAGGEAEASVINCWIGGTAGAVWDISGAALALVLSGEVCNAVSDVLESIAAGGEAEASVFNCWTGRTAGVVEAACSGGRRTTSARACQRGNGSSPLFDAL